MALEAEQFEVYRSLGYHVVEGYFSGTRRIVSQRRQSRLVRYQGCKC
ncbi:MAG: hypothetical protein J2P55_12610 [Rhizobiales bacterium]|nr:hypothetical protein [Hyphomicrobiales bacterium]